MEHFEILALQTSRLKPKKWRRYIDDVWVVLPHGLDSLDHLKSIHPNIIFGIEVGDYRELPLFDVMTKRK